jgi:hypothetical protein
MKAVRRPDGDFPLESGRWDNTTSGADLSSTRRTTPIVTPACRLADLLAGVGSPVAAAARPTCLPLLVSRNDGTHVCHQPESNRNVAEWQKCTGAIGGPPARRAVTTGWAPADGGSAS